MIHKQSPKKDFNINDVFKDKFLVNRLLSKLEEFICLHIDKQIEAGANIIQIFDSWAGLLPQKDLPNYCYMPNLKIVNHVKKKKIPIICFPRGIKNYKEYSEFVKPDAISIDYKVDPHKIIKEIQSDKFERKRI